MEFAMAPRPVPAAHSGIPETPAEIRRCEPKCTGPAGVLHASGPTTLGELDPWSIPLPVVKPRAGTLIYPAT